MFPWLHISQCCVSMVAEDIEEERRREEQKRKDIETCFGFDMEEGDQVVQ